jgi:hypothetical protein
LLVLQEKALILLLVKAIAVLTHAIVAEHVVMTVFISSLMKVGSLLGTNTNRDLIKKQEQVMRLLLLLTLMKDVVN